MRRLFVVVLVVAAIVAPLSAQTTERDFIRSFRDGTLEPPTNGHEVTRNGMWLLHNFG